ALRYALHTVGATLASITLTSLLVLVAMPLIHLVNHELTRRSILFHPYFPAQIAVAVALGYVGSSWFKSRSALWVWVLPTMFLTLNFYLWKPPSALEDRWISAINHFFGSGCEWPPCADRFLVALPFYTSVAYMVGALLDRTDVLRFRRESVHEADA